MSDTLINKMANLEAAIKRVREVWCRTPDVPFEQDLDKQQLIFLNLQYAFQDLLDLANHLVRDKKLGWPQNSADTFDLLKKAGLITEEQKTAMKMAIPMRNRMVHRYKTIDLEVIKEVIEQHLDKIIELGQALVRHGQFSTISQVVPAPENNTLKPR